MSLIARPLELTAEDWGRVHATFDDRTVFSAPEWLSFLVESQQAKPVFAEILLGNRAVGYFSGLVFNTLGVKILGSPMPGWTTSYMGPNLCPGIFRPDAVRAIVRCAFEQWRCAHVELMDRGISCQDAAALGYAFRTFSGFEIDLTQSEERVLANMTSACRRCIRSAEKRGVVIERAHDDEFVDDYFDQLLDVFKRQGLVPHYGKDRVRCLIKHHRGTERLLLLRARDPQGQCIATGIFPAMHDTMYFWGGASWRASQCYRPNEALQWHAMRYWKAVGIRRYDMGGGGEYKRKYGGREIVVPWLRASKYCGLETLRAAARHIVSWSQLMRGRVRAQLYG